MDMPKKTRPAAHVGHQPSVETRPETLTPPPAGSAIRSPSGRIGHALDEVDLVAAAKRLEIATERFEQVMAGLVSASLRTAAALEALALVYTSQTIMPATRAEAAAAAARVVDNIDKL